MPLRPALAVAFCLLALPGGASALTCYTVLDRSDNVVYRDTYPPVDLSDQGQDERARMRARGEHLLAMESEKCPSVEFFTGNAGSAALNVDEVVAGMPARRSSGVSTGGTSARGAGSGSRPAAAAAPAKSQSPTKR